MEDKIISNEENDLQLELNVNKYPALKAVINIIKIFAWLAVIGAIFGLIGLLSDGFNFIGTNLPIFIGTSTTALILFAIAESLKVLIDIEYNTRKS